MTRLRLGLVNIQVQDDYTAGRVRKRNKEEHLLGNNCI